MAFVLCSLRTRMKAARIKLPFLVPNEMEFARLVFMSTAHVRPGSSDTATLVSSLVECIAVLWR